MVIAGRPPRVATLFVGVSLCHNKPINWMKRHRTKAVVSGDGSITVGGLPFPEGAQVDVVVIPHRTTDARKADRPSLAGSVRRFDDPFEPAMSSDDWESA
jgi:hypothetical protein